MAIAEQDAKLMEILLSGSSRRESARDQQEGVAAAHGKLAEVIVHERSAAVDAALFEVIVKIPFRIRPGAGLNAQSGRDRGEVARIGHEGKSSEVGSGSEDVAPIRSQCPVKGRIKKILLREFPSHNLAHLRTGWTGLILGRRDSFPRHSALRSRSANGERRHALRATVFHRSGGALGIETVGDCVLHFVGIAQNVALIKTQDAPEVVHTGNEVINQSRFDHMLKLASAKFAVVDAGERGWAEFDGGSARFAVYGIILSDANSAIHRQLLSVKSIAEGKFGANGPIVKDHR